MRQVGIIGYRSWIAKALVTRLETQGYEIVRIDKSQAGGFDSSSCDCLYIIPGRVVQNEQEREDEVELVRAIVANHHSSKRLILLSSSAITTQSEYGLHKDRVERKFFEWAAGRRAWFGQGDLVTKAVRPGAVFGAGQDRSSSMLIPSIAREGSGLYLEWPDRPARFVHVDDLATHMSLLATSDKDRMATDYIYGTFEVTPRVLARLFETWEGLRGG